MARWRKIVRVLHRDLGYFFVGMTVIYALSGILLNHIKDWNSSYAVSLEPITLDWPAGNDVTERDARALLKEIGEEETFKSYYFPSENLLKIFFQQGSLVMNTQTGEGKVERLERRPVLYEVNFLHYNPGTAWTVYSDVFCVALLIIGITGLFILRGKHGIKGRGAWLGGLGVVVPIVFLLFYL
jgi:hypothetical protein